MSFIYNYNGMVYKVNRFQPMMKEDLWLQKPLRVVLDLGQDELA